MINSQGTVEHHAFMIGVCIRSASAIQRLGAAAGLEGIRLQLLSPDTLIEWLEKRPANSALVYDLMPGGNEAEAKLRDIRRRFPTLPILLYTPHDPDVDALIQRCGALPTVHVHSQFEDFEEIKRLRELMLRLAKAVPREVLLLLLRLLLPNLPPLLARYNAQCITRLTGGFPGLPLRVGTIARSLGVTYDRLERTCSQNNLPSPKRLASWLTLLAITVNALTAGSSTHASAEVVGVDSKDLKRVWSLLPESVRSLGDPNHAFEAVLMAFAKCCQVPEGRAQKVLSTARPGRLSG